MTYTDEQLDRIDAAVAEKVMGWKQNTSTKPGPLSFRNDDGSLRVLDRDYEGFDNYWSPTRDGNAMLEVMERMEPKVTTWKEPGEYTCAVYTRDDRWRVTEKAATMPLAVCLAALKAVGAEVQG